MSANNMWFIRLFRQSSTLTPERNVRSFPCPRTQATEVNARKMLKLNYFAERDSDAVQIIDDQGDIIFTYTLQELMREPSMYQRGLQAYREGRPRDDMTETFDRDGEWDEWLSGWDHSNAVAESTSKRER